VPLRYPTALIFVDESAVKVSGGRFFVVGAVKVRRSGELLRAVQDIRDRHGYQEEQLCGGRTEGQLSALLCAGSVASAVRASGS
jgi:hypothetical protein